MVPVTTDDVWWIIGLLATLLVKTVKFQLNKSYRAGSRLIKKSDNGISGNESLLLNKDLHKLEDRKKEAIIHTFNNSKQILCVWKFSTEILKNKRLWKSNYDGYTYKLSSMVWYKNKFLTDRK